MTEQERRALYFRLTGKLYSSSPMWVYEGFCKGLQAGAEMEREACAKMCEQHADVYKNLPASSDAAWAACIDLLDAIRARGQG